MNVTDSVHRSEYVKCYKNLLHLHYIYHTAVSFSTK